MTADREALIALAAPKSDLGSVTENAGALVSRIERTADQDDRKWIVRTVMPVYGIAILVYLGAQLYLGRYNEAADVIKTAVLPVVTLVLGYYCARPERR